MKKESREFWKQYNLFCISKIEELILNKKQNNESFVFADFHIHSNFSSDAKQSLDDILNNTKSHCLEIISITDHDSTDVYSVVSEKYKKGELENFPILVTGIEHTTSYPAYGEMCHILKHFIYPFDESIKKDIDILEKSYFNRAKIQISRIYESDTLSKIIRDNDITISYEEFLSYLKSKEISIPDYAPLIDYIADEFAKKNVSYKLLFDNLIEENIKDECSERRIAKQKRYEKLKEKYASKVIQNNRRFLLSILAVRGVDDRLFVDYKSSGSLSVNEYGQPDIFKLNKNGITSFAHPTEKSVQTLLNCENIGGGLIGIEDNYKNDYINKNSFYEIKNKMNLSLIKGSDAHSVEENVYENMDFYKIDLKELENYIKKVKEKL